MLPLIVALCSYQCSPLECPVECELVFDTPGYCYLPESCPVVCDVLNVHSNCSDDGCPLCATTGTTSCPDLCSAVCVAPVAHRVCRHTTACGPPKCELVCPDCVFPSAAHSEASHGVTIGMSVAGALVLVCAIGTAVWLMYRRKPRVTSPPIVTYQLVASE